MPAFFDYIRNITYYLLFAAFIHMASPGGQYQKYVRLVTGLVLAVLILQPLGSLIKSGGIPVTQLFAGILPETQSGPGSPADYEGWQYETLKEAFEQQLHTQLQALLAQNGYTLQNVEFTYAADFSAITRVTASVSAAQPKARPFIYIEPVQVGANTHPEDDTTALAVKKLIADFYQIEPAHIDIRVHT